MTETKNIKNLKGLVASILEDGEKIVDSDISVLTAPGENFGSIVLRILIKVENTKTGKQRSLDTVGKIIPESKKVQKIFNTSVTFRNEYKFYSSIVPLLDRFSRSKGISTGVDFTAGFVGGRLNLDNSDEVNTDAVILMKNLKSMGYRTGKKTRGLDLSASRVVLDSLAKFHAYGLALRLNEPNSFEEVLRPYFSDYEPDHDYVQQVKNNLLSTLQNNSFTEKELLKAAAAMDRDSHKKGISEKWGTMTHYDTWTNNMMLRYEDNVPVHCMMVDFQDFGYGSPLNDVMFFLFTSVQRDVFENSLDELLNYYHQQFIDNLHKSGVNTKEYTKESYDDEVTSAVKNYEYCHTIWMLVPILREDLKSLDELDGEETLKWNDNQVQKIVQLTRTSLDRHWL